MTYKKLTYSGKVCNSYLYFSFHSDFFDPEMVTKELAIQPTSVKIKKDPVPKSTTWVYEIEAGSDIDLESHLGKLLDIFEPKIEDITRIKEAHNLETQLHFVIDIDINPDASTPYFGLDKRAIDFLSKTKTHVDFDLYKADTIGLLAANENQLDGMKMVPKLSRGQVTLFRCDVNTGHVLKTNGELYLGTGELYQTFDSIDLAENSISTILATNPDMEFIVYDHEGKPILSWNRFERKRLN